MSIFRPKFQPPRTFENESLVIFPTDEAFYLSDYEAVMKSKNGLRVWSQSDWPKDSFTAEENKEDLLHHVADNKTHAAYGYMIYAPDHKTCYGSLYVNPLAPIPENYSISTEDAAMLAGYDARLDFWVVDGEAALERQITESLREWMKEGWAIRALFACRREMRERQAIYRALGLELLLDASGKSGNLMLFKP
jgi:hypothetical protein